MLTWARILVLTISIIQCIAGYIFNSCIMAVSYSNLRKDTSLNLFDLILHSMGLSNVALLCVLNTESLLHMVRTHIRFYTEIYSVVIFLGMFLIYLNYWLTAWLCVYYCIKIANFMHRLFLRMKLWVSSVLQKLLLMSAVGSFIISVPSLWTCHKIDPQENSTYSLTANCSETYALHISNYIVTMLGCCLPFLLSFISIGLTLTSLWGHICRMKQKTSDFSIPRFQVHSRAARNMILLVVLSMAVCMTQLYLLFFPDDPNNILITICWYFSLWNPAAQAFLLIQGNTKLRRVCQGILHCINPLRAS